MRIARKIAPLDHLRDHNLILFSFRPFQPSLIYTSHLPKHLCTDFGIQDGALIPSLPHSAARGEHSPLRSLILPYPFDSGANHLVTSVLSLRYEPGDRRVINHSVATIE